MSATMTGTDRPSLGYLIPEFPGQTHIWMWREIVVLRAAGVLVKIVSTRQSSAEACKHDFAEAGRRETHYVYPPSIASTVGETFGSPAGATRMMAYAAGCAESSARGRLKVAAMAACAADLVAWARRERVAHVHAHSCADAAHICALAERLGGPSYSLTLHGDLPVYGVDHASKMRRATCITTDGPHLVEQICENVAGIDPAKVTSNWMGVNTEVFIDAGFREPVAGRLRLITVARLHRCKGHRFALEALRRVVDAGVDCVWTLVGDGPDREEIVADVARLGLTHRVTFTHTAGEAVVLRLLQQADAFVLPSVGLGEAGPISVMEAMSTALPVVCSIIGATPQMIRDGETGLLIAQQDVDGLTRAFAKLAGDIEFRKWLGVAARSHAVATFDSRQTGLRLLDWIERTSGKGFRP